MPKKKKTKKPEGVTVQVRGDTYRVPNDPDTLAIVDRINANDVREDIRLRDEGVRLEDLDGKRVWPR